jgi:hypothetical protein
VYQDGDYLYPGKYSQTICQSRVMMIPPSGREHEHGKIQYIPGKQILVTVENKQNKNGTRSELPTQKERNKKEHFKNEKYGTRKNTL